MMAMDAVELQHWMRIAAIRAALSAAESINNMIDKSKRRIAEEQRKFQVHL